MVDNGQLTGRGVSRVVGEGVFFSVVVAHHWLTIHGLLTRSLSFSSLPALTDNEPEKKREREHKNAQVWSGRNREKEILVH